MCVCVCVCVCVHAYTHTMTMISHVGADLPRQTRRASTQGNNANTREGASLDSCGNVGEKPMGSGFQWAKADVFFSAKADLPTGHYHFLATA